MKPNNFRKIVDNNCMSCFYCKEILAYAVGSSFPIAGIRGLHCTKYDFELSPVVYMPEYTVKQYICDDWEDKNGRMGFR